jgi:hypothetical protein
VNTNEPVGFIEFWEGLEWLQKWPATSEEGLSSMELVGRKNLVMTNSIVPALKIVLLVSMSGHSTFLYH